MFAGAEINIQVTYRPLVVLASDLADSAEESDHRLDDQADPEVDEVGAGRVATGVSRKPKRQRPPSERGAHLFPPLLEASEAA